MGTTASAEKNEYRNDSGAIIGVVIEDVDGKPKGIGVAPGDTVWLSESERIRTANAPRRDEDNPLSNGSLVKITEGGQVKSKRPIDAPSAADANPELVQTPEDPDNAEGGLPRSEGQGSNAGAPPEPPAAPEPGAEAGNTPRAATPPQGKRPATEEVGAPEAPAKAAQAQAARQAPAQASKTPAEKQAARGQVESGAPAGGKAAVPEGPAAVQVGQGGAQYRTPQDAGGDK